MAVAAPAAESVARLAWLASPAAFAEHLTAPRQGQADGLDDLRIEPWVRRPHLELISRKLVAATFKGPKRLIVLEPPQTGKTSLIGQWWPAWLHELHSRRVIDRAAVLHATYSDEYGRDWGRKVRLTLSNNADQLYTRIRRDSSAAGRWSTKAGGVHIAGGLSGTGRTGRTLVIDDPIKGELAWSKAARDAAWGWWLNTAIPRLAPDASVVVVATRYHEDDFPGRLLSPEHEGDPKEWTVVRMPAIAEDRSDPLGRAVGEPLYRPDVTQTRDQALAFWDGVRKSAGEYTWNGQYQQRPSAPKGTIFHRDKWGFHDHDYPRAWPMFIDVDCAFKSTDESSYVVVAVWAYQPGGVEPKRVLVDLLRARMDFAQTKVAVRAAAEAWPRASSKVIENKANGPAVVSDLKSVVAGMEEFDPNKYGSKEARAWAIQGDQASGRILIPRPGTEQPKTLTRFLTLCAAEGLAQPDTAADWVNGYIDELAQFPRAAHDDQVDVTTMAVLWIRERGGTFSISSPAKKSWKR